MHLTCKPRRFKVSIGTEELRFNHVVVVDICYIKSKPVLHVVGEATHFQSAIFLSRVSTEHVWKALRRCWIDTYMGPPDFLRIEQGSQFKSQVFSQRAEEQGISILEVPIECPNSLSHVEGYHEPLRAAFMKIRSMFRTADESDSDVLQLAVQAVNNTLGPEGLIPTLLVFGALPRPARNIPAPRQTDRARAIDGAMKGVKQIQAQRKVQFALKYRGPYGREREDLYSPHPCALVLVYRQKGEKWEGPHRFVSIDGDTVVVEQETGRKIFRSNVVKPYKEELGAFKRESVLMCNDILPDCEEATLFINGDGNQFAESYKKELKGLKEREVFEIVPRSRVPKGTRIHSTKWVDIVKRDAQGNKMNKSRLVAANFDDPDAASIPTTSPTVKRLAQRLILLSAACHPEHDLFIRDISMAYIQSDRALGRDVFVRAPKELELEEGMLLKVYKPLYGIPESGKHWFGTYHSHHIEKLSMIETTADRCLLYKREDGNICVVLILQVDDSVGHGTYKFLRTEEEQSKRFQCKPRKILAEGESCNFNGTIFTISRTPTEYETKTENREVSRGYDPQGTGQCSCSCSIYIRKDTTRHR